MDIKSLPVFVDLARDLHFAKTSEQHNMSASTLSRLVQRLEAEAGVGLLERNNRRVALTPAGLHYLQFARQTLALWRQFQRQAGAERGALSGRLSLYCSVTASHSLLDEILFDLRHHQPDIEIQLHTGDQALSLQRLKQGREDLAIAAKPERADAALAYQPLSVSELVFIGPRRDCAVRAQLDQRDALSSAALLGALPWIVAEKGLARRRLNQWLRQQRLKPRIYAQVTGHEAIVSMVSLGCGVGLVPKLVLTNSPLFDSIEILEGEPFAHALPDFEIGLCILKRRVKEPLIEAVWQRVGRSAAI